VNNSFDLLLNELNHLTANDDYESALSLMKRWLDTLAVDYRLHGRVFASYDLDQLCLKIGKNLLKNPVTLSDNIPISLECSTIFVTSELHLAGGHTKLLEDYIRALGHKSIKVLVTDPTDNVDRQLITKHFNNLEIELKFSPPFASLLDKLRWLMQNLAALKPKECYLLNHANDPVAIAGMQPDLVPHLKFIHHCDHTLTLGIHLPHAKHLDFRLQGFNNCRNNLGIVNNVFIPLVAPDVRCLPASGRFLPNDYLHTCTSGGYKFEIPYAFHLVSELPKWLTITNGIHTHIGNLSPSTIHLLRTKLSNLDIAQDRFRIIPFTNSLWSTLIEQKIDLYIDSFPVCGVRSVVEAMGAGVPTTIHYNYANAMWSNINFAYPEAFIWREPSELEQFFTTLDRAKLEQHSQFAREYYLKHHHPDQLKTMLKEMQRSSDSKVNHELIDFYKTDSLRAFMDQFAPIAFQPQQQKEILSQFLAFSRAADVIDIDLSSYLKDYLSPSDYNLFKDLVTEIRSTSHAINNLNSIYPILTNEGTINVERFTQLLYKIATANGSKKTSFIGPKVKAKLLYQRLKSKYNHLLQQKNPV